MRLQYEDGTFFEAELPPGLKEKVMLEAAFRDISEEEVVVLALNQHYYEKRLKEIMKEIDSLTLLFNKRCEEYNKILQEMKRNRF